MKLCISRCASVLLSLLLLVAAHAGHAMNAIVLIDDLNPGEFSPGDPFSSLTEWPTDVDGLLFFTATRNIDSFTTESRLGVAGPEFMSATKLGLRAPRAVEYGRERPDGPRGNGSRLWAKLFGLSVDGMTRKRSTEKQIIGLELPTPDEIASGLCLTCGRLR